VFGETDPTTALVLAGLFVAILLALLSFQTRGRRYVNLGVGLFILATTVGLLIHAFARPGMGLAIVVFLLALSILCTLLTYQNIVWGHLVWWIGAGLFLLALPFLGLGRGDLALLCIVAGPGLLMLMATLHPEIPAQYARLGAVDAPPELSPEELGRERGRYTRLAAGITLASLLAVWALGPVPQGPVTEASGPVTFDAALAQKGAQEFQQYGCSNCHSVTGQPGIGPSLKGVYNHKVRLDDGREIIADEAYIRESILDPDAKIVNGYQKGVMVGVIGPKLPEISQPQNLQPLIEYIKSLAAQ
jgi:cytochrome c